jgi:hypothetical protein
VRWVLTRRAAITVGVSAFMLFVALRYTSYVQHQRLEEKERRKLAPPSYPQLPPQPPTQVAEGSHFDAEKAGGRELGSELLAGEGVSLG